MLVNRMTDRQRIFKKLSAYGRAIEAGKDGTEELNALDDEMFKNPYTTMEALSAAETFQGLVRDNLTIIGNKKHHEKAPQRIDRIKYLQRRFNSPEFTVYLSM